MAAGAELSYFSVINFIKLFVTLNFSIKFFIIARNMAPFMAGFTGFPGPSDRLRPKAWRGCPKAARAALILGRPYRH
jgi:hypothetical protein